MDFIIKYSVKYAHIQASLDKTLSDNRVTVPSVDSLCFRVTSFNRLLRLQVSTDFTEILLFVCSKICYVVDAEFCENLILFGGVMNMCSGVNYFPGYRVE